MTVDVKERSEYFRGLLLLIAQDRVITEPERILMKRIGKILGFEQQFCEDAIRDVLENTHIAEDIPHFSSPVLSRTFIKDGLLIARSDNGIHRKEAKWLEAAARHNGVDEDWFEQERALAELRTKDLEAPLEVESFLNASPKKQTPLA